MMHRFPVPTVETLRGRPYKCPERCLSIRIGGLKNASFSPKQSKQHENSDGSKITGFSPHFQVTHNPHHVSSNVPSGHIRRLRPHKSHSQLPREIQRQSRLPRPQLWSVPPKTI